MKKSQFIVCLCLLVSLLINAQTNYFPPSGNVGIGTLNPTTKLAIQGDNQSLSVAFNTYNYSTTQPIGAKFGSWGENSAAGIKFHRWLGSGSSFHVAYIGQAQYNYDYGLDFRTNTLSTFGDATTSRMYIKASNGNVGIGTTNPDSKLTVKGNIHTNEVKVDLLGAVAPDYVFYKDYDLKSLQAVEEYISTNGHLPNIPSAKDMETDGIMLKEMNLKLLEKIEELTLYAIEQEKKLEKVEMLESELENQKIINTDLLEKFTSQETRLQNIEALLNPKK